MLYLIIGILLSFTLYRVILWQSRKDPHQDHADTLAELDLSNDDLDLRDNIADEKGKLNKKRSKVTKKENKLEK